MARLRFIASVAVIAIAIVVCLPVVALALTDTGIGNSTFFTTVGIPIGDTILNGAVNLLTGPVAGLAALGGFYKTAQGMHDAQHTGEYANKATFGYLTMAVVGTGAASYSVLHAQAAKAAGLVLAVVPHVGAHLH